MKAKNLTCETILDMAVSACNYPDFRIGDTIAVHQLIKEGDKERVQIFRGDVISIRHKGASGTFTVRKIGAHNVAVERIYPYYSPIIKEIELVRRGKTRRAKAYYMRQRVGRSARFDETIITSQEKAEIVAQKAAAKLVEEPK